MYTVTFSCRIEITQKLPDNTSCKSLNEVAKDLKYILQKKVLDPDMDVKISDASVKATVPFD